MPRYYEFDSFGTVVKAYGNYIMTYDHNVDLWYTDNSNAYSLSNGTMITEEEALSFVYKFRR